jgi:hypothetical protein
VILPLLVLEPGAHVGAPVADAAADAEAVGPGAEVAPVAEGGDGGADDGVTPVWVSGLSLD